MNRKTVFLAAGMLFVSSWAWAVESDAEYVKRNTATSVPPCTKQLQALYNFTEISARNICACTMRRLFSENPVSELRQQEKENNRAATNKLVQPLMRACTETELAKSNKK